MSIKGKYFAATFFAAWAILATIMLIEQRIKLMEARHLLLEAFTSSRLARVYAVKNKNQEVIDTLLPIEQDILQYAIKRNITHLHYPSGIFAVTADAKFYELNVSVRPSTS